MSQPEVRQLAAVLRQHDVSWLDVAVHEPGRVQCRCRYGRVTDCLNRVVPAERLAGVGQRSAGDVFHRVIQNAVMLARVIQAHDVGRRHRGKSFELAGGPSEDVGCRGASEDLDRDELGIHRQP